MTEHIPAQRYGPTSGVGAGITGLLACAVIIVVATVDSDGAPSWRFGFGAAAGAVLIWAYLLRPRIVLEEGGRTLLLRNPFVDRRVPLAAVKVVGVRAVTTVKTDERRFDCVAVGHPVRKLVRTRTPEQPSTTRSPRLSDMSVQDAMTEQVLYAADQARLHGHPADPVQRRLAVPELALLGACLLGLVLAFVL